MAITLADFTKIWASTSPLTPYAFSDANYQNGWNFVGATPPSRQMWDFLQKQNDEKMQWLYNNKLSLSGGTMTGDITLADGGKALSDAVVGTVVTESISSSVSLTASTAKTITSVSLTAGTWIVNGHVSYNSATVDKIYGAAITTTPNNYGYAYDGAIALHSALNGTIVPNVSRILTLASASTVYLCGYATATATVSDAHITAVRIV